MSGTFRKMLDVVDRRTKLRAAGVALVVAVTSVLEGLGLGVLLVAVQATLEPSRLAQFALYRWLDGYLHFGDSGRRAVFFFSAVILFYLLKNLIAVAVNYLSLDVLWRERDNMAKRLFESILAREYVDFVGLSSAEVIAVMRAVERVVQHVLTPYIRIAGSIVVIVSLIGTMFVLQPVLTFGVLALAAAGVAFVALTRTRLKRYGADYEEIDRSLLTLYGAAHGAIREIKLYDVADYFVDAVDRETRRGSGIQKMFYFVPDLPRYFLEVVLITAISGSLILLALMGRDVIALIPFLTALVAAASRLIPAVNQTIYMFNILAYGDRALGDVQGFIARARQGGNARLEVGETGPRPAPLPFQSGLVLRDASFRYPGRDEDQIANVSLDIRPGESIGLVGPTGSGKTTLGNLLLGLLLPREGVFAIDGLAVVDNVKRWRRSVAFVPQDVFITDDTLRSNIALGTQAEEIDRERLDRAIDLSRLGDVVARLPRGLDTRVGERGAALSGGQRQRIGIARAIYYGRAFMVLDEATSALDTATEREIMDALDSLHRQVTTVIIAHRLSTVRGCDRLYYLDRGRIVASGTYDELLGASPGFRKLVAAAS